MGFESALVDRARLLRRASLPVKLEGRTQFVDVEPGDWFPCRLTLPSSPESYEGGRAHRRVVIAPTLLYPLADDSGNPLAVKHTDRLEVDSDELGADTWEVTAEPEPIRKKVDMLGWQVTLRRVKVEEFVPKI